MNKKSLKSKLNVLLFAIIALLCVCVSCSKPSHDKNVLRINVTSEPDSFSPWKSTAADTHAILYNIFEGLYTFTETGDIVPCLAKSYEVSDDGTKYTFKLNENVKFHNGKPFTSADAVYTYKKLAGLDGFIATSDTMKIVTNAYSLDDYTFVIELQNPVPRFIALTATAWIVPENYENHEDLPIGTGPYKFLDYQIRQKVTLQKNEEYWNSSKAASIPTVEIYVITDEAATIAALQSNQLDIAQMLSAGNAKFLKSNYNLFCFSQNMVQIFAMNNAVEPFNNPIVRKAIAAAINKDSLVSGALEGYATKLDSNFSPILKHYYNDELSDYNAYDPEKAKTLLAQAGYPNGFELTITVPGNYQIHVDAAQIILSDLAKVGINAKIETIEWASWLSDVYANKQYQTTVVAFSGKLDPAEILKRYNSTYSKNFVNYKNPAFDEAFALAQTESDDSKVVALYKECQKLLAEDSPCVFICDPQNLILTQNYVENYTNYPVLFYDFSKVSFSK